MSTLTQKVIDAATNISGFIKITDRSESSITFLFKRVPSYAEQLSLQNVLDPNATDTRNVRCFICHNDGSIELTVRT